MTICALAALTLVLALPTGWCLGYRTRRQTATVAEHAARPPGPHAGALADELALAWHQLTTACCLTSWETHGAQHDPDHCTRKDQTT
ncbi:hypothetical protein ACF09J_13905 [Streptomyces sp. NPDC014889]|uniref:hypothetical protein n=1 Tax=Streptomyces sp. NPDC014889 TaxID=3364928 RepID=UPI0037003DD4